jgi:TPR repeat protein
MIWRPLVTSHLSYSLARPGGAEAGAVPVDFTVAVEFFRKAADLGHADSPNSLGCCLERGNEGEADTELAVRYHRKVASQSHTAGLCNFGIERDLVRAAKC